MKTAVNLLATNLKIITSSFSGKADTYQQFQLFIFDGTYSNKARTAERTTQYFMEPNKHANLVTWNKMKKHWR